MLVLKSNLVESPTTCCSLLSVHIEGLSAIGMGRYGMSGGGYIAGSGGGYIAGSGGGYRGATMV
jgi:hypothetical protein